MKLKKRKPASWLNAYAHAAPTDFGCLMASVAVSLPLIQSWSNLALKRGNLYTKRLSKYPDPLMSVLRLDRGEKISAGKKTSVTLFSRD